MSHEPTFKIAGAAGERALETVRARLADRRARGIIDDDEIARVSSTQLSTFEGDDATAEIFRRCCVTWEVDRQSPITSHRAWIGPPLVAMKRILRRVLRFQTDAPFARQRDFNWNLLLLLRAMLERDGRRR